MKKNLLLLVSLLGCFTLVAQEPADSVGIANDTHTLVLSLSEAQHVALEHNRTLQNASLDVQKAEASRWQSIASMLPQVNASFDYTNMCGYKMNIGGMGEIPLNPNGTLGVTAAVALSGAQVVAANIGTLSMKMADVTQKQTEQQITDQVKSLYYSALVMDEMVNLLDKNLVNVENLYASTQKSVEVGVAEQTDADQLAVQVATLQTSISSTKRSTEMVYNSMRLQLGIGVDTEIQLSQNIDDLVNVETALNLLGEDFVLDNNYNYQLLKQNTELLKKQVHAQEWAYGPTVSLAYQYSYKTYFGEEAGFNMTPPNTIAATVSLPIFSSGKNLQSVRAAKIDYKKQLNTLTDTEESLRIQHRQLCYNLSSTYETYETQKKNMEVVQRVLANISNKYTHGVASSLEVTNASTNFITAQNSYVQALLEFVNAQIELEQLLNKK